MSNLAGGRRRRVSQVVEGPEASENKRPRIEQMLPIVSPVINSCDDEMKSSDGIFSISDSFAEYGAEKDDVGSEPILLDARFGTKNVNEPIYQDETPDEDNFWSEIRSNAIASDSTISTVTCKSSSDCSYTVADLDEYEDCVSEEEMQLDILYGDTYDDMVASVEKISLPDATISMPVPVSPTDEVIRVNGRAVAVALPMPGRFEGV